MNTVRKFQVKTKLSKAIVQSGGISASLALKRAEQGLERIRIPCVADIDASLARIDAQFGPGAADRDSRSLEDLYALATRIIDVAICMQGSGIDLAARSLCDLIDLSQTLGVRDWPAVDVHIDALKMLRAAGLAMDEEQISHIIGGLARVTRKRVGDHGSLPQSEG